MQHGKPWPNDCVLFATEPCPRGLRVEVCDLGTFDSALEPAPLEATSGRGMQIIAALVDRLEVRNGDGPTLVGFEKHRGPAFAGGDRELEQETPLGRVNGVAVAHPCGPLSAAIAAREGVGGRRRASPHSGSAPGPRRTEPRFPSTPGRFITRYACQDSR